MNKLETYRWYKNEGEKLEREKIMWKRYIDRKEINLEKYSFELDRITKELKIINDEIIRLENGGN